MSSLVRTVLLVGCGLVAALEAPQASDWLSVGLAGPYAPVQGGAHGPTLAALPATLPLGLPFAPLVLTLVSAPLGPVPTTFALGR